MLADKLAFSTEKIVEAEALLARQRAEISLRTMLVAPDLSMKAATLVEELTTRVVRSKVQVLQAQIAPMMSSLASGESNSWKRKGGKRDFHPRAAEDHSQAENPQRREPAVMWAWVKKNGAVKVFHPSNCQTLEKAFQSGAKEMSILHYRTGALECVVNFEKLLVFWVGKKRPKRVQRISNAASS
jgi:hypothetical protein